MAIMCGPSTPPRVTAGACLLLADYNAVVRRIAAQPFPLRTVIAGVERKHVPDFLLITDSGWGLIPLSRQSFAT